MNRTAPFVILAVLTLMMAVLVAVQSALLASAHGNWRKSNDQTKKAIAGWEEALEANKQWRTASERFEAVANACLADLKARKTLSDKVGKSSLKGLGL